jgi:hypothetical protein
VAVTPDGRYAVSGSVDQTLRLWDLESGHTLRILEGHTNRVYAVAVAPDGRRAVSGSADQTLRLWDLESGQTIRTLEGHAGAVTAVAVTPDGRCAVSGSWDETLRLWDLQSVSPICRKITPPTPELSPIEEVEDESERILGPRRETYRKTTGDSRFAVPAASEALLEENVQFTVYRPREIQLRRRYKMLIFSHLDERPEWLDVNELSPIEEVEDERSES